MRPEAILQKEIRLALARDKRVAVVPNFVGKVVAWALVARVLRTGDIEELRRTHPVAAGLGEGSADLVGMVRGSGRVFCLEVKLPTGVVEPHQVAWHRVVRRYGGFVAVARSTEDALAAVERALHGASE